MLNSESCHDSFNKLIRESMASLSFTEGFEIEVRIFFLFVRSRSFCDTMRIPSKINLGVKIHAVSSSQQLLLVRGNFSTKITRRMCVEHGRIRTFETSRGSG